MNYRRMFLKPMLVVLVLDVIAAGTAAATAGKPKPGCEDSCGNLSIPYPFGTTDGCYHDSDFFINCSVSSGRLIPLWRSIEVTNVSVEGQMHVLHYLAHDCYDSQAKPVIRNIPSIRLTQKFRISSATSKFTAIGCDTYAYIEGYQGDKKYGSGCISVCESIDYVTNGSCSGIGCCQTAIPEGVYSFKVTLSSFNNHTNISDFNPCSYAFVAEDDTFNFSSASFSDLQDKERHPLLLEWAIGDETCLDAKKNKTSYACKDNSECHDLDNGSGYRCSCFPGYDGNPYLNGCQDIDECKDPNLNPCVKEKYCTNKEGNSTCFCPKGYSGNGRKDGNGCIRDQTVIVIRATIGTSMGVLFLVTGSFWLLKVAKKMREKKLKERFFKRNGGLLLQQQKQKLIEVGVVEKAVLFNAKDLEKATDNFNENRVLGRGGQGTVYKGMLTDGRIVAIKKSKLVDESQVKQFINEVVILSQINHRHVVKLLGCCLETEVPLLVYEFVSNGTLSQHIHDESDEFPISWSMRLQIALEVAEALAYLHSATSIPIYHRDIKSTNILLDEKYKAIVSDFGTSRLVAIDQTHLTTLVQGTFGYFDPEYFQSSHFSEKSDVYSFGVVIVELLTGRKPIFSTESGETRSLAIHFREEAQPFDILDARVLEESKEEELNAVVNLARRCLNLNGKQRPTMKEVATELEGIRSFKFPSMTQTKIQEVHCTKRGKEAFLDNNTITSNDVAPLLLHTV